MFNGMGSYPGLAPLQGLSPEEEEILKFYGASPKGSGTGGTAPQKAAAQPGTVSPQPAVYIQPEQPQMEAPSQDAYLRGLMGLLPANSRAIDAEARQKAKDEEEAFSAVQKGDWPMLGLMFGLSLMANSERNGFGSALGRAGLDTLGSYANTTAARRKEFTEAQERALQNRRLDASEARQNFANAVALGNLMQQGRHNDILERKNLFDAYQKFWKDYRDQTRQDTAQRMLFGGTGGTGTGAPVVPIPGMPQEGTGTQAAGFTKNRNTAVSYNNPSGLFDVNNPGQYRRFGSLEEAFPAYVNQIGRYINNRGLKTYGDIARMWVSGSASPSEKSEGYVADIGRRSGIDMGSPVDLGDIGTLSRYLSAQAWRENEMNISPEQVAAMLTRGKSPSTAQGAPSTAPSSAPSTPADPYAAQILSPERRRQLEYVAAYGDSQTAQSARSMISHDDQLRLKQAELQAKAGEPQKMNDVSSLGQRWKTDSADYLDASRNLAALIDYANLKNGAGDLGLIFSYMKMLDPGSVVREGEQEQARKTSGISDQLWATLQRVQSGEVLTPAQRRQFVEAAHRRHGTLAKEQARINDLYTRRAKAYNVDPIMVISDVYADLPKTAADWLAANPSEIVAAAQGMPTPQGTPQLPPGFKLVGGKK